MSAYVLFELICAVVRLFFLKKTAGLSIREFTVNVFMKEALPLMFLVAYCASVVLLLEFKGRFVLTLLTSPFIYAAAIYFFGLCPDEKEVLNGLKVKVWNRIWLWYRQFMGRHYPKRLASVLFRRTFGRRLDWKNPKDLNEKKAIKSATEEWRDDKKKLARRLKKAKINNVKIDDPELQDFDISEVDSDRLDDYRFSDYYSTGDFIGFLKSRKITKKSAPIVKSSEVKRETADNANINTSENNNLITEDSSKKKPGKIPMVVDWFGKKKTDESPAPKDESKEGLQSGFDRVIEMLKGTKDVKDNAMLFIKFHSIFATSR